MPRQSLASIFGVEDPRPPLAMIFGPSPRDADEDRFRAWYAARAKRLNLDPNPDDPRHHYDYRAAYRAGAEPDPVTGHWPSTFKADDHPNRYVGILDTKTGQPRPIPGAAPGLGAEPEESVGDRAAALGNRFVTAAAEGIASIPEFGAHAYNAWQDLINPGLGPGGESPSRVPDQYPTLGKPGGFFDLKADRENIHRQSEAAAERLRGSRGAPEVVAAADTIALGLGAGLPFGEGAAAARRGERVVQRGAEVAEEVAHAPAVPVVQAGERRANAGLRAEVDAALARLHETKPTPAHLADLQAQAVEAGDRATEVATERYAHDLGSGHFAPPANRPSLDEIFDGEAAPEGGRVHFGNKITDLYEAPPDTPSSGVVRLYRGHGKQGPGSPSLARLSDDPMSANSWPKRLSFTTDPKVASIYEGPGGGTVYLDLPEEEALRYRVQHEPWQDASPYKLSLDEHEVPAERAALAQPYRLGGPPVVEDAPAPMRIAGPEPQSGFAIPAPPRRAVTERGTAIDFDYELRDASELVASHDEALRPRPDYPPELQPRDRSRMASEAQVSRIERQLNPELLGESPHASSGAPIIGPDGIVESGNARSIALQRAYRRGGESAGTYRDWLEANAPRFGIDPAEVAARREPVLVRVRRTDVDRAAFAAEANEAPLARMSATEQAAADAQHITPEMLDSLRIPESGEVNLQVNRDFVRAFASRVNPNEMGAMFDTRGMLSNEGQRRLQGAILARAYDDPEAVAKVIEHADSNVRSVGAALLREAPRFARLREGTNAGSLHALDLSGDVGAALRKLSALREEGTKVPDYLAQGGLFGSELTPESRALLALFDANGRSGARVASILDRYADLAEGLGHPQQAGLFGARAVPSRLDLLREAANGADPQGALFAMAERPPLAPSVEAELAPARAVPAPTVREGLFRGMEEPAAPPTASPEPLSPPRRRPPGPPLEAEPLPGMEPPPPGLTTGTKHAVTRAERLAAGLPEVENVAKKDSATWAEAKARFESDPEAPRTLAQHLAAKPRPISDVENDLLLHDRIKMTLDHREALTAEDAALQAGDQEGAALARLRRQSIEQAKDFNDRAIDLGGSESGRALRARQKLIAEDYSPLHLTQRYRVANEGVEAPEPIRQKLTEISAQLEAAQARAAAAEERAQELEALRLIRSEQGAAAKATRSGKRAASRQDLDGEMEALRTEWRGAIHVQANISPEQAGIMARMAKNRIRSGVNNLTDLVDTVYQETKPYMADLEPRDVRDVIAGAGPAAQKAARPRVVSELAALRREARVLNALDDARAKLGRPGLTPAGRKTLEGEIARWEGEAAKISAGTTAPGSGPLPEGARIAAAKARVAKRMAELQEQIASGTVVAKGRAPVADAELLNARGAVRGLQRQADTIIRRREMANRSGLEKGMDWTAGWGRFLKLTGTATLQKISAAAAERALVFKPIEEFIGAGLSKLPVVSKVAAKAPIEGGGSLSAIAKSYGGFFGEQARAELRAGMAGRETPMELAFKSHASYGEQVPAWMEYPGRVHTALKSPARVAGYQYAMEKQAQWYLGRGEAEELLNPVAQEEMKARAWEYAMRDIFMGDNAAVRAFNKALGSEPGESMVARGGKTAGRVLFPIVKVPTNYALEVTDYALGLPKGMARLGDAVRMGLDELPVADAELIMRQLKKGSLGAGLIALGATGLVEAGGYYEPGKHRREGELQPGEVSIAGVTLPHMLLHHPAVEALQIGASLHRSRSLAEGLSNAAWGTAEQVPFFEEPIQAARTLRDDPTQFFGSIERGLTIPPDVQRLARVLDQKKKRSPAEMAAQQAGWGGLGVDGLFKVPEVETKKRKARGGTWEQLLEEEMLGVPVARGHVR